MALDEGNKIIKLAIKKLFLEGITSIIKQTTTILIRCNTIIEGAITMIKKATAIIE
jgi:hypothetical protein